MAELGPWLNGYIKIGAVDLSDHAAEIRMRYESEPQDDTVMGDTARSEAGGLKNWEIEALFNQDHAAGSVDATLWAAVGTEVAIEVRPDAGAVSPTNPKWTGNGHVRSYEPMGGAVGEMAKTRCVIGPRSDLTRATA